MRSIPTRRTSTPCRRCSKKSAQLLSRHAATTLWSSSRERCIQVLSTAASSRRYIRRDNNHAARPAWIGTKASTSRGDARCGVPRDRRREDSRAIAARPITCDIRSAHRAPDDPARHLPPDMVPAAWSRRAQPEDQAGSGCAPAFLAREMPRQRRPLIGRGRFALSIRIEPLPCLRSAIAACARRAPTPRSPTRHCPS